MSLLARVRVAGGLRELSARILSRWTRLPVGTRQESTPASRLIAGDFGELPSGRELDGQQDPSFTGDAWRAALHEIE